MVSPDDIRRLQEQHARIQGALPPRTLRLLEDYQQRVTEITDRPAFRYVREQQRFRDTIDPPALRQLQDQQARIEQFMESSAFRSLRGYLEQWQEQLPPPLVAQVESYQEELAERVVRAAEEGNPSWLLLGEINGLRRALRLIAETAGATMMPTALALLIMLLVALDLADWLAKRSQDKK